MNYFFFSALSEYKVHLLKLLLCSLVLELNLNLVTVAISPQKILKSILAKDLKQSMKKYQKSSFFPRSCILENGFKEYILADWLLPPKEDMHIWNDVLYKYQIYVHRCSHVHVCKLRSVFCFQKISTGSWAPNWTFLICAMQCFMSEVFFLDHCSSNRCSGDLSASLLRYISFLGIISWKPCLVSPLESLVLWTNVLFLESVEWNIVSGSAVRNPEDLKDSEKTPPKL